MGHAYYCQLLNANGIDRIWERFCTKSIVFVEMESKAEDRNCLLFEGELANLISIELRLKPRNKR